MCGWTVVCESSLMECVARLMVCDSSLRECVVRLIVCDRKLCMLYNVSFAYIFQVHSYAQYVSSQRNHHCPPTVLALNHLMREHNIPSHWCIPFYFTSKKDIWPKTDNVDQMKETISIIYLWKM